MRDPQSNVSYTAQAFEVVPQDLRRRIALRQSVEMVRVTMEFFEEVVPLLARSEEQLTALTAGILRYSRDLAFAAATAYADQAEARGAWDTRMEANVVDAVVRGDTGPELQSQAAALNWDATAPATVIVGLPQPDRIDLASDDVHDVVNRNGRAALVRRARHLAGGDRVGPARRRPTGSSPNCSASSPTGPVVIGPTAPTLAAAHCSATEAIAGMNAVAGWSGAPRPVSARELLPERALLGDAIGDRRAGNRGDAAAGRRRSGAHRDAGRVSGLRRRDRGVRPQIVRSSKYRPLPAQTYRRLHRPRSHHFRATPTSCGWPRRSAGLVVRHTIPARQMPRRAGHGQSVRRRSQAVTAQGNRLRSGIDGVASHAVLWSLLQKHKTRFIISYTAQNRLHSVLLKTCLHCLRPDRARRLPACSPRGSSCPARPSVSLPGRQISGLDLAAWAPPRPPRRSPTPR